MLKMLITMSYRNLPTKSFHVFGKKRIQTRTAKENREYRFVGMANPADQFKGFMEPLLREKGYDPSILTIQIDPTPLRGRHPVPPVLGVFGAAPKDEAKIYADLKSCFALAMIEYETFRREIET